MEASNNNKLSPRQRTDLQGGKKDILLSFAVIVIPMVSLTAILLGLVTHNQVPQTYSALLGVPDPLARESSAFLVDFSATRLLTVASWASSVSSLLPPFAMVLLSYPVARTILNASREKNTDNLPTPYQLSMLLGVLSGSIGSLWSWFKYRGWNKRERVNSVAEGSIIWLVFVSVLGVVNILTAPFVTQLANLANLAQSAAGEDTPSAFVESWTTGFSAMVLGLSAGIMSRRANIVEQTHISTLVARVPKAPLITLVFLNLLYAVVGVVLAVMAAQTGPGETKNVQGRLSVAGLTAKCFESKDRYEGPAKKIQDLFAEKEVGARDHRYLKVSVVASDCGGWKYESNAMTTVAYAAV